MHIVYPAVVAALLFSIGVYGVLARRNTILVLMSVELMLNAVNLNLVAFDVWLRDRLHGGQVLTLFVIVIAAAELGVGLAIVLALYRNRRTVDLDHLRDLSEDQPAPVSASRTLPSTQAGDPGTAQPGGGPSADQPAGGPSADQPGGAPGAGQAGCAGAAGGSGGERPGGDPEASDNGAAAGRPEKRASRGGVQ
ncbi:hypothetical protein GCM10010404_60440 [Nonomuraea africana]|uniref:NADH-quinone oxidoreductase subunit K n=1 Tax=Nonomuraea africana TaxID=46171 RepID=A0ABR9KU47_9ACTN|nr:NADH-quinone oxidoreductase subunit K [Nonomuraea africana]